MATNQGKKRQPKLKPKTVYSGAPVTETSDAEMDKLVEMTPERIAEIRAAAIPELRALLDAKEETEHVNR